MDSELAIEVNELFGDLYPYLAQQILETSGKSTGLALEMGPYGPGISLELARQCPALHIVLGDTTPEFNDYFRRKIAAAGLQDRLEVREIDKYQLPFPDATFDLVIFRGGLFFWEDGVRILQESYRVLKPGGVAMVGGGFGASTPNELIEGILDRSRELNRRLQKRRLTQREVGVLLEQAGLRKQGTLDSRHGLWVILRKEAPKGKAL